MRKHECKCECACTMCVMYIYKIYTCTYRYNKIFLQGMNYLDK